MSQTQDILDISEHRSQMDFHRQAMHSAVDKICRAWPQVVTDSAVCDGFGAGRGYDGTSRGGGESSAVEAAALSGLRASAWIAELHDVTQRIFEAASIKRRTPTSPAELGPIVHHAVDRIVGTWTLDDLIDFDPQSPNFRRDVFGLYRLADRTERWWPTPTDLRAGEVVDGVTVGRRGNQVHVCDLCGQPVAGGRADPVRYVPDPTGGPDKILHKSPCWYTYKSDRENRPVA